jgi:hypothetical protein
MHAPPTPIQIICFRDSKGTTSNSQNKYKIIIIAKIITLSLACKTKRDYII